MQPPEESNWNALFDADNYMYFLADSFLGADRTEMEIRFIRNHCDLGSDNEVLDLACGHGRHANPIAPLVRRVKGLDMSERFIAMARRDADSAGLKNVEFQQRDIRAIESWCEYDRVLLLNTVFGIFEDAESRDLLRKIAKAMVPGGLLCLDVVNRDTILVDFVPTDVFEKEGNLLIDRYSFDPLSGRMSNRRLYIRNGTTTQAPFSLRLFNYTELSRFLQEAGLTIKHAYGDWEGAAFSENSKKIVVIAEKSK